MKKEISVRDMVYVESILNDEKSSDLFYASDEIYDYALRAFRLPIDVFKYYLENGSSLNIEELIKKYNVSYEEIIKRFNDAKKIIKYESEIKKLKLKKS